MQPNKGLLSTIFSGYNQYIIPVYQRYYSWDKKNWKHLWEDLMSLYQNKEDSFNTLFMGTLVFVQDASVLKNYNTYNVVDGQQRLLTLSILLIALRNIAKGNGNNRLSDKIDDFLTFKPDFKKYYFRVCPRNRERTSYENLVNKSGDGSGIFKNAIEFFTKCINGSEVSSNDESLEIFFNIISERLEFVNIVLNSRENVYRTFKNLNSGGVDLSEADLIRGFVFENIVMEDQDGFDNSYWKPLEKNFENENGKLNTITFSQFFRYFLMIDGRDVSTDQIFKTFEDDFGTYENSIEYIQSVKYFSDIYNFYLVNNKKYPDPVIDLALKQFRQLNDTSTYAFAMKLIRCFELGKVNAEDFVKIVNIIMSFMIRRLICGEIARSYGSLFSLLSVALNTDPLDNVTNILLEKGYPSDESFIFNLVNTHHSKYYRLILSNIEKIKNPKETVDFSKLQIEHIMPQKISETWMNELGDNYQGLHKTWLNTIGNLTLTGYNPKLYNHDFETKRNIYETSNITITREISKYSKWTEIEIKERGEELSKIIIEMYPIPIGNNNKIIAGKKEKTSKYYGVSFHTGNAKWRAQASKMGTHYSLGYYETQEEAALAYNKKAIELFGSKAKLNDV